MRASAWAMARTPSTISRELRRNAATRSGGVGYRATTAQRHADRAAQRPKPAKLAENKQLRAYVEDPLAGTVTGENGEAVPGPKVIWKVRMVERRRARPSVKAWSPEQIARRLPIDFWTMRPRAPVTRPSTRRCTCKAEGRCALNLRPACARAAPCELPGPVPGDGANP